MRRLINLVLCFVLCAGVASAQDIIMNGVGSGGVVPVSYLGPGDVVSGATAFYGLRAYSAATIGNKVINIRRASDNATSDISTLSFGATAGQLNVGAAATFCAATTCFVQTLYDQVGSVDLTQATNGLQPQLNLSCSINGGAVCILNNHVGNTTADGLQSAANVAVLTQPVTLSVLARWEGVAAFAAAFIDSNGDFTNNGNSSTDILIDADGLGGNSTALHFGTSNSFFTNLQFVISGPSSGAINVNNANVVESDTTGLTVGSAGAAGKRVIFNTNSGGLTAFVGSFVEVGIWNTAFTHTQRTNMCHNQVLFWAWDVDRCV